MVEGDGRLGYRACAPYKAIHVGAAAPELPDTVCQFLLIFIKFLHVEGLTLFLYEKFAK